MEVAQKNQEIPGFFERKRSGTNMTKVLLRHRLSFLLNQIIGDFNHIIKITSVSNTNLVLTINN